MKDLKDLKDLPPVTPMGMIISAVKSYTGNDISLGLSEMENCLPRGFKQSELIRFIFLWFQTGLLGVGSF